MANDRKVRLIIEVDDKDVKSTTSDLEKMGVAVKKAGDGSADIDKLGSSMRSAHVEGQLLADAIERVPQLVLQTGQAAFHLAEGWAKAGVDMEKAHEISGLQLATLAGLDQQTRHYGLTMNEVGDSVKHFTNLIGDANNGSKTAEATLTRLFGADWRSKTRNMDEAFSNAFRRIDSLPDSVSRGNAALDAFGDQGYRLIPIINDVGGSVEAMQKKAKDASLQMSGEDVGRAKEFQKSLQDVEDKARALGLTFGKELAEPTKDALDSINGWLTTNKSNIGTWATETRDFIYGVRQAWIDAHNAADRYLNDPAIGITGLGPGGYLLGQLGVNPGTGSIVSKGVGNVANVGHGILQGIPWSSTDGEDPRNITINPDWASAPYFTGDKPGKTPKEKAPKKEHVLSPEAKTIIDHATALGISPVDLATMLLYEGAGSLSTSTWGGKGGKYLGPMQMGPSERSTYGRMAGVSVRPGMSLSSYLDAASSYLTDRGVKPGASLLQLYEAVNGGHVGVSDQLSDGNGTIAQHVQRMMRDRGPQAKKMFEGFSLEGQSVQDDVARMMSSQSEQLTKEARDKQVHFVIDLWKRFGLVPDDRLLTEIQRVAADEAKKAGAAQPTAADIQGAFRQNAASKVTALGPISVSQGSVATGGIGTRLTSGEQMLESMRTAVNYGERMVALDDRRANFESIIGIRLNDQAATREEQVQSLKEELAVLERSDVFIDAGVRALEKQLYYQHDINDLKIELINLGKDDAQVIEIQHLRTMLDIRHRERDAVIEIDHAQQELNEKIKFSSTQVRAGIYSHMAEQKGLTEATVDGWNETYDAINRVVNGPLEKLNEKTKGFLAFAIRPMEAMQTQMLNQVWGGVVDKVFGADTAMGRAMKSTGNPMLDEAKVQTGYLKQIAMNTGGVGSMGGGSLPGGGSIINTIFGGGGGGMGPGGTPLFNPNGGSSAIGDTLNHEDGVAIGGGSGGGMFGGIRSLFNPVKNPITGKMNGQLAGTMGGIGALASMVGGFIPGRAGRTLQYAGMGAQYGSMFGPWGAAIGAGVGAIFGLFSHGDNADQKIKDAARAQYGVELRDKSVVRQLVTLGEGMFGKGKVGANATAVVGSEEGQNIIHAYAESSGQSTLKLDRMNYGDPNWSGNDFRIGSSTSFGGGTMGSSAPRVSIGSGMSAARMAGASSAPNGLHVAVQASYTEAMHRVADQLERFQTMPAGALVAAGASGAGPEISAAYHDELGGNANASEEFDRSTGRYI